MCLLFYFILLFHSVIFTALGSGVLFRCVVTPPSALRHAVFEVCIVKAGVAALPFATVDVVGDVLADVSVEKDTEYLRLEVPTIHAASHLVRYRPDGAVQFVSFLLFLIICHCYNCLIVRDDPIVIQ
jgi:hypothetical protein